MFYISTKENAVIKTALQISILTFFANDSMRLYNGKDENGKIIWTDPVSVDKKITTVTDLGQGLFANSCASCHRMDKKLVGPALAWVDKRNIDEKTLYEFVRSSHKVIKSGNS